MRVMQTYDYDNLMSLLNDFELVWIRGINGNLRLFFGRSAVELPTVRSSNLSVCEEYVKENTNFAYKYDSSRGNIAIWDKSVEEYQEISASAFQEVDTCGMGVYAYNKYAEDIKRPVPTFKMRQAAESILCDFLEFKHKQ